jgi:hypothetical protein
MYGVSSEGVLQKKFKLKLMDGFISFEHFLENFNYFIGFSNGSQPI